LLQRTRPGKFYESAAVEPSGDVVFSNSAQHAGLVEVNPKTLAIEKRSVKGRRGHLIAASSALYVTDPIFGSVEILEFDSLKKLDGIGSPFGSRAVDVCEKRNLMAVGALSGVVDVIDLRTKKRLIHSRAGRRIHDIAFSSDCKAIFAASRRDGLYRIDLAGIE